MFLYAYYGFIFATIGFVILFQMLFIKSRRYVQLACSVTWLLPVCYEMWALDRCGSECDSRGDILLVFPAEVIVLSSASIYAWSLYKRHAERSGIFNSP